MTLRDHIASDPVWLAPAPKTMPTPFGRELRRLRESRGISQSELGRCVGMDHSAVSRWESGVRNITRANVTALADALTTTDIERHDLFTAAGFAMDDDDDVRAFRELPPAARKALLRMVDAVRGEAG